MGTDKNTLNILLVALSTFAITLKESNYVYYDGNECYNGTYIYQMEPVVQILSKKLGKDTLDKIVILYTAETEETIEKEFPPDRKRRLISAKDYFKEVAIPFMNPGLNKEDLFLEFKIQENDPAEGIAKVVEGLRAFSEQGNQINLYVDNHGGFRGVQLSVEAILSLVKKESIHIADVFNVKFDGENSVVQSNAPEFQMFDFVSGINEFINYGRVESLNAYFKSVEKDAKTNSETVSEAKRLLSIISGIAEAIQICNVQEFEKKLKELSGFFQKANTQNDNYLSLFYQNIEADYKSLIRENHNTLDEIEWCLKKGFYQQCLTLAEARMPQELEKAKVLKWDKDKNKKLVDFVEKDSKKKTRDRNLKKYEEKNTFVINKLVNQPNLYTREDGERVDIEERLLPLLRDCEKGRDLKEKIIEWSLYDKVDHLEMWFYNPQNSTEKIPVIFCYGHTEDDRKQLYCFLVLHKILKLLRNKSNHAAQNETYIPIASIKNAIETYIDLGRSVLLEGES